MRAAGAVTLTPSRTPSRQSQRGLDWFIFFLADVQTGFGPFVAVYLTTQKWTQVEIGLVLSIGGIVGLIGQMPGGAIVDAARSERLVAGFAVADDRRERAGLCGSGRSFRWWRRPRRCTPLASCVLGPAIAAISLGLVGPLAIGERLGRNARFASLGNGSAAARDGRLRLSVCRAVRYFSSPSSWRFRPCSRSSRIREREIDVGAGAWRACRARCRMRRRTSVLNLMRQRRC